VEKLEYTDSLAVTCIRHHREYELPYPLNKCWKTQLSCIQAYDVWQEKKNYGKVSMGVVRTTYLIDEEGMIVKAFDKVKAAENPARMLGIVENLFF